MPNETLSVRQTAHRLGCTIKYVYDLLYNERLSGRKLGRNWRIPLRAVEAQLRKREAHNGTAGR
jgi:excisionase family DNA binding protein